ncbi:hypothetical protein LIER_09771 [Lithospermum erythrorhizon]|uniref:Uncharacterized protein n=1 Tax=Lithospermum erythrorhizon TaxID=34254 RepID=A0AAV3PGZ9_LITER
MSEARSIPHQPPYKMVSVLCPVSFYQWGVDIVGNFPRTPVAKRYHRGSGLLHQVAGGHADHPAGPGRSVSVPEGYLYPIRDTSSVGRGDEPDNLQGRQKMAPGRRGMLGQGAPNGVMVLPNNAKPHHMGDPFSLVYGFDALLPVEIHLETTRTVFGGGLSPKSAASIHPWEARKVRVPLGGHIPFPKSCGSGPNPLALDTEEVLGKGKCPMYNSPHHGMSTFLLLKSMREDLRHGIDRDTKLFKGDRSLFCRNSHLDQGALKLDLEDL